MMENIISGIIQFFRLGGLERANSNKLQCIRIPKYNYNIMLILIIKISLAPDSSSNEDIGGVNITLLHAYVITYVNGATASW